MADDQPPGSSVGGFEGEVIRNYATRSTVHDMLKPIEQKIDKHLGWHEGARYTTSLVIPLVCVLITAGTLLLVNFVP